MSADDHDPRGVFEFEGLQGGPPGKGISQADFDSTVDMSRLHYVPNFTGARKMTSFGEGCP